jgi:hypothetical protein
VNLPKPCATIEANATNINESHVLRDIESLRKESALVETSGVTEKTEGATWSVDAFVKYFAGDTSPSSHTQG